VLVDAKLKDSDGNAIDGEFTAYLDRPVIEPGQWSSFWVVVSTEQLGGVDPNSITDYENTDVDHASVFPRRRSECRLVRGWRGW
jgi:hypothetical protein